MYGVGGYFKVPYASAALVAQVSDASAYLTLSICIARIDQYFGMAVNASLERMSLTTVLVLYILYQDQSCSLDLDFVGPLQST